MTPNRIQTAIALLRANGYRVIQTGAPSHRPRIEGCDAACSEAKHTPACLARKYRRRKTAVLVDGSPLADKIAANQMRDE